MTSDRAFEMAGVVLIAVGVLDCGMQHLVNWLQARAQKRGKR